MLIFLYSSRAGRRLETFCAEVGFLLVVLSLDGALLSLRVYEAVPPLLSGDRKPCTSGFLVRSAPAVFSPLGPLDGLPFFRGILPEYLLR